MRHQVTARATPGREDARRSSIAQGKRPVPVRTAWMQGGGATAQAPSPANAIRLQRSLGNQAARRFLAAPPGLARSPAPEEPADEAKAKVRAQIRYFTVLAEQYGRGGELAAPPADILAQWGRMLAATEGLIDTILGGDQGLRESQTIWGRAAGEDPDLRGQLHRAYQQALEALIRHSALRTGQPSLTLYQQHRQLIPEWAWPTSVADPEGDRVSDALPEAARRNIKVRPVDVSRQDIDRGFPKRAGSNVQSYHPLPHGATLLFGGDVNIWIRGMLEELAGQLIPFILARNTTMTFDLDLVHLGLGHAAYRFTYVDFAPADPKQRLHQVIIEHLGTVGLERAPKEPRQRRFDRLGFKRGATWTNDGEFAVLLEALDRVPDSLLAPLKGLGFERAATDPGRAGGNYDLKTHVITIFDRGLESSATRVGDVERGLMTMAHRNIIHEVGHALDYQALRKLWVGETEARSRLLDTFRPYRTPSGRYSFPASKQALWDRLSARLAAALKALESGVRVSGERLKDPTGGQTLAAQDRAAGANEFRNAALQDGGLRLTDYSEKAWEEYFAETFSTYVGDPQALKRLRPNLFAWFAKTYPMGQAGATP